MIFVPTFPDCLLKKNNVKREIGIIHNALANFTVVVAENQTNGRGQRGANWEVENGKNLTFSVLIKDVLLKVEEVFNLNVIVAVSLFQTLDQLKILNLAIKWPNDILADNRKIGGILIENILKSDRKKVVVQKI